MDFYLENEKRIAAAFLLYGISHVIVEFDGSGDSGQIESIFIQRNDGEKITSGYPVTIRYLGNHEFNPETKKWERDDPYDKEMSLHDAVEYLVYEALDRSNIDWYNDDGGFGYWRWTSSDGLEFSINQRTVHSETVHSEERHLGEEE